MKMNMVLICSFFYSIIKTAANSNQRHKIAGGALCRAGKAEPGRSGCQLPRSASPREGGGPGRRARAGPAVSAPMGTHTAPELWVSEGDQWGSPESSLTPRAAEPRWSARNSP